jgi:hypothetical protein
MGFGAVRLASALPVGRAPEAGEVPGRVARASAQSRIGGAVYRREPKVTKERNFYRFAMLAGQDRLFAGCDVRSLKGALV